MMHRNTPCREKQMSRPCVDLPTQDAAADALEERGVAGARVRDDLMTALRQRFGHPGDGAGVAGEGHRREQDPHAIASR